MAKFLWGDPDLNQWSKIILDHGTSKEPVIHDQSGFTGSLDAPWSRQYRSWITDLDPDHPKGTQLKILESIKHIFCGFCSVNVGYRFTSVYPPPHSLDIRECIVCQHQAIVLQSGCSDSFILYSWIQRDTGEVMLCPTLTMRSLSVPL